MGKIFNCCRLLQQVPIHLPSGICTSFQDHQPSLRTLHSWRCTHHCDVWQWPSIQWRQIQKVCSESLTLCTPHHHLISTSPMVSSRPWWRRSRTPTRKLMDLQMLKQEHYFSYETPLSWQIFLLPLKFFMDNQHKEQSFQDPQSRSTYIRFGRDSLKYRTHRRSSSTEHTEQRIYECSKWMNKYSSFPTNKGQVAQHGWQEL